MDDKFNMVSDKQSIHFPVKLQNDPNIVFIKRIITSDQN